MADAIEDCVKAKHDAIDAMVDFVTIWFKELEDQIGVKRLTEIFPEYLEATSKIESIQNQISQSRQDRIASRDGVYDEIEKTDYEDLLKLYQKMRLSRGRIDALVEESDRKDRQDFWVRVGGGVSAVVAVCLGLFEVYKF